MANSKHDNNQVPTITGLLNTDGSTIKLISINPTNHIVDSSDGSTGSDLSGDNAPRDDNRHTTLIAVSSADGTTPVPLYVNASGQILIKST